MLQLVPWLLACVALSHAAINSFYLQSPHGPLVVLLDGQCGNGSLAVQTRWEEVEVPVVEGQYKVVVPVAFNGSCFSAEIDLAPTNCTSAERWLLLACGCTRSLRAVPRPLTTAPLNPLEVEELCLQCLDRVPTSTTANLTTATSGWYFPSNDTLEFGCWLDRPTPAGCLQPDPFALQSNISYAGPPVCVSRGATANVTITYSFPVETNGSFAAFIVIGGVAFALPNGTGVLTYTLTDKLIGPPGSPAITILLLFSGGTPENSTCGELGRIIVYNVTLDILCAQATTGTSVSGGRAGGFFVRQNHA